MGQLMLINPRKRRATKKRKIRRNPAAKAAPRVAAKSNPIRRRRRPAVAAYRSIRRRARRNPDGRLMGQIMNAAVGGAGAVAVDVIQGYLPLPTALRTGYMPYVVKAGLGFALGAFGRDILGQNAARMGAGAMTVALYGALKQLTAGVLPGASVASGATVAGLGYGSPTPVLGEYLTGPGSRMNGLGAYITGTGSPDNMGMSASAFGHY